jgi:orotidine-5'-phosphate decarboxylase
MPFDSITISPYMGKDSIEPFLLYKDKHAILLALTSNQGAADFQFSENNEKSLFKKVIATSLKYDNADRLMYVVGATKSDYLKEIRNIVPNAFLLIPGVGAQGGALKDVFENGVNKQVGLLVNSSRSILYASKGEDYVVAAFKVAASLQNQMQKLLS